MKSIKFTASGSSSALGNFAPGDIAHNIPDDLAKHMVDDARCAEYLTASDKAEETAATPAKAAVTPVLKPNKTKPPKAASVEEAAPADQATTEQPAE